MPGHETPHPAPAGATPARRRPRFPSRNRRFPDRCRSPDCASTAFRCRCLLLRQKLFVLPCRRLRNNYILCPTGTPTFAAARRQRRDLIIAIRSAHQPLSSHCCQRQRRKDNFAPRRERFFCLRRPHFFQQRKKWGKERRQKLRFCTSSARCTRPWFPASSRGHSPLSPLSDKRTACTFTGAEAPATACPRHGRCFSLLPPHLPSLSLERRTPDSLPPGGCGVEWRTTQSLPPGGKVARSAG